MNALPHNRPLRTLFLLTSMPVGGAETLLVNMIRRFDRSRIEPVIGCLKQKDVLGEVLTSEIPVYENLIRHKYDMSVVRRLRKIFSEQSIDALVTVGAGDKMFWGRLAARQSRLPVILSALHSTGWPDGVGRLNWMLTRITDGFIAVAQQHADYQIEQENFPQEKVFLIPNGIDTDQFVDNNRSRKQWREKLNISSTDPVVGIVAALRPEKNHDLFLEVAQSVSKQLPHSHFVIAGDGPERKRLESKAIELGIESQVHFLGTVEDTVGVLSMLDLFALTSHNEASPVSILEALSCQRPVVAPDVGSIDETVLEAKTGYLFDSGNGQLAAERWVELLQNRDLRQTLGQQGRSLVIQNSSLAKMTLGYTELIESIYIQKCSSHSSRNVQATHFVPATSDQLFHSPENAV